MADLVSSEDRDEMAIPSYLHPVPLMRWMAWRRIDEIAALYGKYFPPPPAGTDPIFVMDYGCGTGVLFCDLEKSASRIYGVDLALEPARLLLKEWDLQKIVLLDPDAASQQIANHSLDAIVAAEVLEHISPLEPTLESFHNKLKPGGKLLVSVPTENVLYRLGRRFAGFDDHYHESNAAAIHAQVLDSGFRQVEMSKIPLPGPLAIYWIVVYEQV
jgi:predicted TPR repeat methyltransferase